MWMRLANLGMVAILLAGLAILHQPGVSGPRIC